MIGQKSLCVQKYMHNVEFLNVKPHGQKSLCVQKYMHNVEFLNVKPHGQKSLCVQKYMHNVEFFNVKPHGQKSLCVQKYMHNVEFLNVKPHGTWSKIEFKGRFYILTNMLINIPALWEIFFEDINFSGTYQKTTLYTRRCCCDCRELGKVETPVEWEHTRV